MITEYRTISSQGEGIFKEKGSKFIAFAYHVNNEEEIKEILDQLRKEYHDARHHCYAWKLGTEPEIVRANDDGEPSNSAGKPILNQIEKMNLTNTLVVVIRYFGGTLLGVPGLINAYRTASESALKSCNIVKKFIQRIYQVEFPYSAMNEIMKIVKEFQLETADHRFEESCSMKLIINIENEEVIMGRLSLIDRFSCINLESE